MTAHARCAFCRARRYVEQDGQFTELVCTHCARRQELPDPERQAALAEDIAAALAGLRRKPGRPKKGAGE